MKAHCIFQIVVGSLFIAQYFFGIDGHGSGAGNIITLLIGILFAVFGIARLLLKVLKTRNALAGKIERKLPPLLSSAVLLIVLGLLWVGEYFFGYNGQGSGAGNIMSLLFGIAFFGWGLALLKQGKGITFGIQKIKLKNPEIFDSKKD